jgi:site-specific DNA-methyltransferase (adenine-specific)
MWKTDKMAQNVYEGGYAGETVGSSPLGRWPANLIHDGSKEVLAHFPRTKSGKPGIMRKGTNDGPVYGAESRPPGTPMTGFGDEGSAARFFYCAKANRKDRGEDNNHPTVKPTELMRYLVRLVTPPGGTVLDPFMGSGSTGKACLLEGFDFIGIEKEEAYYEIAVRRLEEASA